MNEHDRTADDAQLNDTSDDVRDAPAADVHDAPAVHDAPLIADEPAPDTAPEHPAAEPAVSAGLGSEPAADSRWAPPPVRPAPETAAASPALDAAPDLVEPDPVPMTAPAGSVEHAEPAAAPSPAAHGETTTAAPLGDASAHDSSAHQTATTEAPAPVAAAHDAPVRGSAAEPDSHDATPAAATTAAAAVSTAAAPQADPAPQVVYVPAPTPPRKKGNRVMGVGIALASTPVFAAAYAGLALLFVATANGGIAASGAVDFFTAPVFWLPIIAFALLYVLLALIVNRAGWWAHVLGGFVVAVLVYGSFLVATLLTAEPFGVPGEVVQQFVAQQLTNPIGWAAAIAAREVPIWVGGLVAKRGRSVKSRNVEAREAYERELAESRAGRPAA